MTVMLFEFLQETLPPALAVFFMGMLPITEAPGAIITGLTVFHMNPWSALLFAVLGNISISLAIYFLLGPVTDFLRKRIAFIDRICERIFTYTRIKHSKKMAEVGYLMLFGYLAIPTPGSGGWSGALIAYVFNVRARAAVPLISLGLFCAAILVTFGAEIIGFLFGRSPA